MKRDEPIKETILKRATELFYEQGYEKTSFSQIARETHSSKGAITYYYKNKSLLANAVYSTYMKSNKNTINRYYYDTLKSFDLQICTAVEMRLNLKMYHEDPNTYRFYHGMLNNGLDDIYTKQTLDFYKAHHRKYTLNINESNDELSMLSYSAKGAVTALIIGYFNHHLNCSFDDFVDYRIRIPFTFMKIDEHTIQNILQTSKRIEKQLNMSIQPYFKITPP